MARARAATLARDSGFRFMVETLTDRLVEAGELSGEEITEIIKTEGTSSGTT